MGWEWPLRTCSVPCLPLCPGSILHVVCNPHLHMGHREVEFLAQGHRAWTQPARDLLLLSCSSSDTVFPAPSFLGTFLHAVPSAKNVLPYISPDHSAFRFQLNCHFLERPCLKLTLSHDLVLASLPHDPTLFPIALIIVFRNLIFSVNFFLY